MTKPMNMVTHNDDESLFAAGTSLQGVIELSFDDLVIHFGEPTRWNVGETDETVEWVIEFDATFGRETIAIYQFVTYQAAQSNFRWHVGAKGPMAYYDLYELLHQLEKVAQPGVPAPMAA